MRQSLVRRIEKLEKIMFGENQPEVCGATPTIPVTNTPPAKPCKVPHELRIEASVMSAYERYDSDPRVHGPEDFEAFADAVKSAFRMVDEWDMVVPAKGPSHDRP